MTDKEWKEFHENRVLAVRLSVDLKNSLREGAVHVNNYTFVEMIRQKFCNILKSKGLTQFHINNAWNKVNDEVWHWAVTQMN